MSNDLPVEQLWTARSVLSKKDGSKYVSEVLAGAHDKECKMSDALLIEAVAKEMGIPFNRDTYSSHTNEVMTEFLCRDAIKHINSKIQGGFESLSPLLKNYLFRTMLEMHNYKYTHVYAREHMFVNAELNRDAIANFYVGKEVVWNFFTLLNAESRTEGVKFVIHPSASNPHFPPPGVFVSAHLGVMLFVPGLKIVVRSVNAALNTVELVVVGDSSDFLFSDAFLNVATNMRCVYSESTQCTIEWDAKKAQGDVPPPLLLPPQPPSYALYKGVPGAEAREKIYEGQDTKVPYTQRPENLQANTIFFCAAKLGPYEVFSTEFARLELNKNALKLHVKNEFLLGINKRPRIRWLLEQPLPIVDLSKVVYKLYADANGTKTILYEGKDNAKMLEDVAPGTMLNLILTAEFESGKNSLLAKTEFIFSVQSPSLRYAPAFELLRATSRYVSLKISNYAPELHYLYYMWKGSEPNNIFIEDSIRDIILIRGLEPNTKYYISAMGYNSSNACSETTAPYEIITGGPDLIPQGQCPQNFKVKERSYTSIALTWDVGASNPSGGQLTYDVLYRQSNTKDLANPRWYKKECAASGNQEAIVRGLTPGCKYEFVLFTACCDEKYPEELLKIESETEPLPPVENLVCTNVSPTDAKLQWDPPLRDDDETFFFAEHQRA